MRVTRNQFIQHRRQIPPAAKEAQKRFKRAMRAALNQEVTEFREDAILDVALAGDREQAVLYRFRAGWDVSHRIPLCALIHTFLHENQLCWEDMTVIAGTVWLSEPGLSTWRNWHRSYSETHGNLFLQPKAQNRREPRLYHTLPSREHGSF